MKLICETAVVAITVVQNYGAVSVRGSGLEAWLSCGVDWWVGVMVPGDKRCMVYLIVILVWMSTTWLSCHILARVVAIAWCILLSS